MEKGEILANISLLGHRVVCAEGMEIVHVDLKRQRGGWFLRLYIDKPGGVTLADCEKVSRQLGAEMDARDLIPSAYTLEVSSPGLDRPLRNDRDFQRFVGHLIAVSTYEPVDGQRHLVGRLRACESGLVTLLDDRGSERNIERRNIAKARLEVEF